MWRGFTFSDPSCGEDLFAAAACRYRDYLNDKGELDRMMAQASRPAREQAAASAKSASTTSSRACSPPSVTPGGVAAVVKERQAESTEIRVRFPPHKGREILLLACSGVCLSPSAGCGS